MLIELENARAYRRIFDYLTDALGYDYAKFFLQDGAQVVLGDWNWPGKMESPKLEINSSLTRLLVQKQAGSGRSEKEMGDCKDPFQMKKRSLSW